jgi:hypothetical protein
MAPVRGPDSDGSAEMLMKNFYELWTWISRLYNEVVSCNLVISLTSELRLFLIELIKDCKYLDLTRICSFTAVKLH